jgi:hypothetical protein
MPSKSSIWCSFFFVIIMIMTKNVHDHYHDLHFSFGIKTLSFHNHPYSHFLPLASTTSVIAVTSVCCHLYTFPSSRSSPKKYWVGNGYISQPTRCPKFDSCHVKLWHVDNGQELFWRVLTCLTCQKKVSVKVSRSLLYASICWRKLLTYFDICWASHYVNSQSV